MKEIKVKKNHFPK